MDEFIEVSKPIKFQGNSWAVFIKSEAESLGLRPGDAMENLLGQQTIPEFT